MFGVKSSHEQPLEGSEKVVPFNSDGTAPHRKPNTSEAPSNPRPSTRASSESVGQVLTESNGHNSVAPDCPSGLFEWPKLKSMTLQTLGDGWEDRSPPEELEQLPEGDDLPPELSDILKWSLQRVFTPQQIVNEGVYQEQSTTATELPIDDGRFAARDTAIFEKASPDRASRHQSRNRSRSGHSRRSSSLERCFSTLRNGKTRGILGSARELLKNRITGRTDEDSTGMETQSTKPIEPTTLECTSCFEDLPAKAVTNLACTHSYCSSCFRTMITTAMQIEASFPPKCCLTEIPLSSIILALNPKEREEYKEKAAEYAIPAGSRWYCPSPKCSKWIPPAKLHRIRTNNQSCPHCHTKMCSTCRGLAHADNTDCPQDFGLEATLEIAQSEGWQRCYRCRAMVELETGCHHITCKCGAQFCYVCGEKWRICACSENDAVQRREDLRRQRTERDAAMQAEAEEVARAIAEVEEFERQQEAARMVEEARYEEKRRKEEEELAKLEQMRLEEEEEKRRDEEEMERQSIEIMKLSIKERAEFLRNALKKITNFQQYALASRHRTQENALVRSFEQEDSKRRSDAEDMIKRIVTNIDRRTKALQEKQKAELAASTEKGHANNDVFINVQIYLTGRLSREEMEQRAHEEFTKCFKNEVEKAHLAKEKEQAEERLKAVERHRAELEAAERHNLMDREGVERSNHYKQVIAKSAYHTKMKSLGLAICADQKWFESATERRMSMLEMHYRQMLHDFEAGEPTVGLTEAMATHVLPLPAPARRSTSEAPGDEDTGMSQKLTMQPDIPDRRTPSPTQESETIGLSQECASQAEIPGRHTPAPNTPTSSTSSSIRAEPIEALTPRESAFLSTESHVIQHRNSLDLPIHRKTVAAIQQLDTTSASTSQWLTSDSTIGDGHARDFSINSDSNPWEDEASVWQSSLLEGSSPAISRSNAVRKSVGDSDARSMLLIPEPLLIQKASNASLPPISVPNAPHKLKTTLRGSLPPAPATGMLSQVFLTHARAASASMLESPSLSLSPSVSTERAESILSSVSESGSLSTTSVEKEKKTRWPFGRKAKEYSEEEIRKRMKHTIGDALLGPRGGWA